MHSPGLSESLSKSARSSSAILVAIPFYKNEQLVDPLLDSLIACAGELAALQAEILLFNDSPDYAPLQDALERAVARAGDALCCRLVKNEQNLGFVRTMNAAMAESVRRRRDIVLLNSDTIVFPGALGEMARVADLDPMIAFVNPRSNNATLATLPHQQRPGRAPQQAFADAQALAAYLPDYTYAPTAVGFCMLIRWKVLAEFSLFDEIYGRGYNEENDLVMRAGRCGYRAVLANKAFVWHEGEQSFGVSDSPRNDLDAHNRKILLARYPEYKLITQRYFEAPSYLAEELLGTLLGDANGKLDFAFDFSNFGAFHNGTFRAAEQVLREAAQNWRDKFNLHVLCSEDTYAYHNYARFDVARRDPHGPERFAVIFRIGQPYDWNAIERLTLKGACIGLYALDTISIDCSQLYDETLFNIWQFALEHFDLLATTSMLTTGQFERRFTINPEAVRVRTMHSLDLEEYRREGGAGGAIEGLTPGYMLIVGNHYPHKFVAPTAQALSRAFPERAIVAFSTTQKQKTPPAAQAGQHPPNADLDAPNVHRLEAGNLTDAKLAALFGNAAVIVFPSHYEGFGLPVLEALAASKPIFARRTSVTLEIQDALGSNPNIHLYETTEDLVARLANPPCWVAFEAPNRAHDAAQAALDLRAGIERAIGNVTYDGLVRRIRGVQHANTASSTREYGRHGEVARFVGLTAERFAAPILRVPLIYAAARGAFRFMMKGRQRLRALVGR